MTKRNGSDAELDRLLAETGDPVPAEALMQRVMADADAVLAERRVAAGRVTDSRGWMSDLLQAVGGWPAVTGLATAAVGGIWIGFAQPGSLANVAEGVLATGSGYDLGDFMPDYDSLLVEG